MDQVYASKGTLNNFAQSGFPVINASSITANNIVSTGTLSAPSFTPASNGSIDGGSAFNFCENLYFTQPVYTGAISGGTGFTQGTIYLNRLQKIVTCKITSLNTAINNSDNFIDLFGVIPVASYRPSQTVRLLTTMTFGSNSFQIIPVLVKTDGTITFYSPTYPADFNFGSAIAFEQICLTWMVA